ncbi:MAG: AMP-binding protein [Candidatus Sedimenticola endophacoides]
MNTDQTPTIPQLFRATAAARGDQPAICFVDREVCFGEIDRASDGIAAALAGRGIGKGDRVALYCINR